VGPELRKDHDAEHTDPDVINETDVGDAAQRVQQREVGGKKQRGALE
jgi:hypothetical protein